MDLVKCSGCILIMGQVIRNQLSNKKFVYMLQNEAYNTLEQLKQCKLHRVSTSAAFAISAV